MGRNILLIAMSIFLLITLAAVWYLGVKDWLAGLSITALVIVLIMVIVWEIELRPRHDPVKAFFLRLFGRLPK